MSGPKNRPRSRRARPSPVNLVLEPGSQDDIRPFSPPDPLSSQVVVVKNPDLELGQVNNNTTNPTTTNPPKVPPSSSAPPEIPGPAPRFSAHPVGVEVCAGPDLEEVDQGHDGPVALARHLELFIGHRDPVRLIADVGIDAVNGALQELPHTEGIRSPAGWLSWRALRLANGARPVPPPAKKLSGAEERMEEMRRDAADGYPREKARLAALRAEREAIRGDG